MDVILCLIVVLSIIIWALYQMIDSSGAKQFGHGILVRKNFTPARTHVIYTPTYTTISSMYMQPQFNHSPDCFQLHIQIASQLKEILVSEDEYMSFNEGDTLLVKYSFGRFSKNEIYIKQVMHYS